MIQRFLLLAVYGGLTAIMPPGIAQPPPGGTATHGPQLAADGVALAELFGEELLSQNAAEVCLALESLAAERRYDRLADWVLPSPSHRYFRVSGAFRRPATLAGQRELAPSDTATDLARYPEADWILSPAIELIRAAAQTDQLGRLAERIELAEATTPLQAHRKAALRCMVCVAQNDVQAVAERLEQLFSHQRFQAQPQSVAQRWADLLVLWSTASNPATAHLVGQELLSVFKTLHLYAEDIQRDVLDDYLRLLRGRCDDADARADAGVAETQGQFATFSYIDASTHGNARPLSRFFVASGSAHKITGHETDYLAFRSPLLGNYEVDCEVATHPGAFTSLMVAGTSLQPREQGQWLRVGSLRKPTRDIAIDPPLEPLDNWTRFRVVVRDGIASHFVNGRQVYQTPVHQTSDPWVAFRSWRRAASTIRNVHITGTPQIPETISLLTGVDLAGWGSYYDSEENDGLGRWHVSIANDQSMKIIGDQITDRRGSHEEDLLRYLRPILDDGTIEYQYLYEPDVTEVHPSLGRLVLLLEPTGVRIHQLTDGLHERTDLRPDNATTGDSDRGQPANVPLVENGWNQVQLRIEKDVLLISVNGQAVYQHKLDATNSRIFGLFHYADQTRAVVGNITLSGRWPQSLPPLDRQQLASKQIQQLDRSAANLPAKWAHDFRAGAPPRLFDFDGDRTSLTTNTDGIRLGRRDDEGVKEVRACLEIDGDFDIVADYADLEISPGAPTWHCGVGLAVTLNNSTRDRLAIHRRADRMAGKPCVAFARQAMNDGGKTAYVGGEQVVDQSISGRLRLARRGENVYALHAIDNSTSFRLISSAKIPGGPIEIQGLRLITEIGTGLHTNVTWRRLAVHADKISMLDVQREQAAVAMLNQRREQLPERTVDFTKHGLADPEFYPDPRSNATTVSDERGVSIRIGGEQGFGSAVLYGMLGLHSGFDVQADVEVVQLDRPKNLGSRNEVVLQISLGPSEAGDRATTNQANATSQVKSLEREVVEASIILRHKGNGEVELVPRVVGRNRLGRPIYRPIRSIPTQLPDMYRIVLHNRTLYYLYSQAGSAEIRIAATYPLEQEVTAGMIRLSVIAAEEGGFAEARWKKVAVFGNQLPARSNSAPPDVEQPVRTATPDSAEP